MFPRFPRFFEIVALSAITFSTSASAAQPVSARAGEVGSKHVQKRSASVASASDSAEPEARVQSGASEAAPKKNSGSALGTSSASVETSSASVDLSKSKRRVLDSGLEVILQATPGAPRVTACTAVDAGSRLDPRAGAGAYRVLGEMLKDGGYRSSSQDYAALVVRRGGTSEVVVTHDVTTFCTSVPAGELSLALWVTAGRFTQGKLSDDLLKQVVNELAKESESADAKIRTGRATERLRRMAFLGNDAYAHPILPNGDDLDALSLRTLRRLHRESYVAKRSTIAISGDFDESSVTAALKRHLAGVPEGKTSAARAFALVEQSTSRFSMAEDKRAKTPAAWYGWVAPQGQERLAMQVALSTLVSESRLGTSLVGKRRAAQSLELYLHQDAAPRGHALYQIGIVGTGSRSLGTIEKAFDTQINQLASRGPTASEVVDAQRRLREKRAQSLVTSHQRAYALAQGVRLGRSADEILSPLDPEAKEPELSREEVRLAALHFLGARRRSAIEIYPKGWQDPWQKPMRQYHIVSRGQTLGSIANKYGTSVGVIIKMNGIKRNKPIYPGDKLRVPRVRGKKPARKPRMHKVRRGDTMGALALKYGVSSRAIADANGMGSKMIIRTGESLRIPWSTQGASKNKPSPNGASQKEAQKAPTLSSYKVKSGETLSGIAAKHGVSTTSLARANGLSNKSGVRVGQSLKVPPRGTGKKASISKKGASDKAAPAVMKTYKVTKGDTLSGIAKRHGVSVKALTVANGISRKSTLRLGQRLKIPAKD